MSAAPITLRELPGGFIRDCEECGVDVGDYDAKLRTLTATLEQIDELASRARHYARGGLDGAPLWMKPAAAALLRAIERELSKGEGVPRQPTLFTTEEGA